MAPPLRLPGLRPTSPQKPLLSVVVVAYSMARELKRTLYSLSPKYQRGVNADEYEVIVVDNGSPQPPDPQDWIQRPGWSVQLLCRPPGDVSPCRAVNAGVAQARAEHVCVMVDGARMVSPGLIAGLLAIFRADADAFAITLGWHLGPQPQNISILQGYNQGVEDRMLRKARWREDGYRLFSISSLALSSAGGWFAPITESNCFALKRHHFQALGGFDERFVAPGGGLVNLDFFRQAIAAKQLRPWVLLGEGSFHQIHGGVATNVPMEQHPGLAFSQEYEQIRGEPYVAPQYDPQYLGALSPVTRRWIAPSMPEAGDR